MKVADKYIGRVVIGFAAICLSGAFLVLPANAAPDIPQDFDSDGEKIFNRYNDTPLAALTGTDGRRTLNSFYELRQYSGSPPRVPHEVPVFYQKDNTDCIACHGRGGYDAEQDAYAPVTPHPENENCYQCHVPQRTEKLFVETNWRSINPPKLGRSQLGGSPPSIPHSLQLREDCIACHTGPAAVAEIRVEHASRGNCRQCHVPMVATELTKKFQRNKETGQ
jgi:cytochrome c-type protein NapB